MSMTVELAAAPFDPAALLAGFNAALDGEGAVVSFTGYARDKAKDGRVIDALVLETYRGMTLSSIEAIAAEAHDRFAITRSHVVHRSGTILPGEAIVFVAAASAHRRAAFEAADYLMDRLKTEAVFWKYEVKDGIKSWIEPTTADVDDASRWTAQQD